METTSGILEADPVEHPRWYPESFVGLPLRNKLLEAVSRLEPPDEDRDDHDRCEAGVRRSGSRPDTECSEKHQNDGADGEDAV